MGGMKMKFFNLDEYLKKPSLKVVTRDGRAVRIICTDYNYKGTQTIIAIVAQKENEDIYLYHQNGRWTNQSESNLDLFFAPVKREGWVNLYFSMDKGKYVGEEIYHSEEEAIKNNKYRIYIATIKIEWEE